MLREKNSPIFDIRSTGFRLSFVLFILLWTYLIIRTFSVFYIHDELVTKWSYIIHWNPFPNQGAIDANNHFLLSLIGGFFTRLFNSNSMFVIRLGSLLAFPIYFWSIYGLKNHFRQQWNFYAFLLVLTTTSFLIEFFSMARGYGLALAFLMLALQQMMSYFDSNRKRALIGALVGWLLAVYASLTLLPIALVAILYLAIFTVKRKFYFWILPILLTIVPFYFFIEYSFLLKDLGKLYYGGMAGFFATTVHSLTKFLWYVQSSWLDAALALLAGFILFVSVKRFWINKNLFDPKLLFSILLFVGVASILGQNWILGVNFPEDRTALFLIIFFFGALFLAFDEFSTSKWFGLVSIGISVCFFAYSSNFTHHMLFFSEHLDEVIVRDIPASVHGTPPTTAGRWNMEIELTRELDLPLRVYQDNDSDHDTLVDYMVFNPERRPGLTDLYKVLHRDEISGLALLERKKLLKRTKTLEVNHQVITEAEFQNIHVAELKRPMIFRCSGKLEKMTEEKEIFFVFSSEDSLTHQAYTYELVPVIRNKKINDKGEMTFDFTYAMNLLDGANHSVAYIWNQNREELQGDVKLEVYTIHQ